MIFSLEARAMIIVESLSLEPALKVGLAAAEKR